MSDASDVAVEGMVTMQERIVNLINQLNMPLIEVSLVVGRHIAGLSRSLDAHIETTGQVFNERITTPWPIEEGTEGDVSATFDLEKIFKIIDEDRMDILGKHFHAPNLLGLKVQANSFHRWKFQKIGDAWV